ncbi:MAG: polysaccharide deacetylase family protein [Clostridia bacterium]|nr:polysaccharide deacetylase family protein [Clostridia bacterium]
MKHVFRLFVLTLVMTLLTTSAFAYPPGFLVYHGSREEKKIAITVDDCYDVNVIRMIHELSVEYDFPITWFVVGNQFRDEEKELWESIIAHGSEIGNHTWKHPYLTRINIHFARNQILLTQERIDEMLGYHYPLRLLRPPYGVFSENGTNLLNMFYEYGVEKTIMWDVSNTDPKAAFRNTQNGSILLYHTNYKDVECLRVLIPMLLEEGYELVTVSELLGLEPLEIGGEKYVFPYR